MINLKKIVKGELSGWKKVEVFWLLLACGIICGISLYWEDTIIGIIAAVSGVASVILVGKGKLSAYIFGIINVILYAIIAFKATYYGGTILNLAFYLPMQFVGLYIWSNHMNEKTNEVKKRRMTLEMRVFMVAVIGAGTAGFGFILSLTGDAMPIIDSFTTVASIVAMIITIQMFSEQWWIWIAVDVFSIILWTRNFLAGNMDVSILMMWIIYLINSIVMWRRWNKEAKLNAV